ncbi:recombinase family protein [Francisella sp. XLW-1]|uniref:recombinase family protein n=1 Tax=Francisella sp. XLW-1 TaxID=2610887 RepID=UPI00123E3EB8|nr:recombinase family protein [Francisella sp. XLW-1]
MSLVGYARVSSTGQKLDVQVEKLKKAGCKKIFKEKITGVDQQRPALKECLNYLREHDTLVITKLDRLARSNVHLNQIVTTLEEDSISLYILDQKIDLSTPTGRLMFQMLSVFAEFENNIRKERQADGIKKALANNIKFGVKPKFKHKDLEKMKQDRESGMLVKDILEKYNISKASFYRLIK